MPQYESRCSICGEVHEYIRTIDEYMDTPVCCGKKTEKIILSVPYGIVDIPAYQSPISGKWINSRKQRKEDLIQNSCRPWEGMDQETKEAERHREYQERANDAHLERVLNEVATAKGIGSI